MFISRKIIVWLTILVLVTACKSKKKTPSLSGEDPVEVSDFINFFKPLQLPYQFGDTILPRKEKDSLLISHKIFTQFVPDSVLTAVYGKTVKPKIYAVGKVVSPGGAYLFVKSVTNDKKVIFILAFDSKEQFAAALTALRPDNSKATSQSVTMDRRYAITKIVTMKNPDGSPAEGKDVYSFDSKERNFALVMTDALNDKITELINPIDTFARQGKWSADYSNGKMNLVSVRDGRRNDRISFFIHFEKNNGTCIGELKGEAILRTSTTAEYRMAGDPCVLKFIFSSKAVTLKEEEGCGSRRGLNCSFDGSFAKKKNVKPVSKPATKK